MELSSKKYNITKTNNYFKTNLLFLFNGLNRNSNDWTLVEQNLKKINFNYYKLLNKTSKLAIKKSIYKNLTVSLNGVTFIVKSIKSNERLKQISLNKFQPLLFNLISIKLNNRIYSAKQLQTLNCLNYCENKLVLYKFGVANLKIYLS